MHRPSNAAGLSPRAASSVSRFPPVPKPRTIRTDLPASADHRGGPRKRGRLATIVVNPCMRCTYRPVLALAFLATSMVAAPLSASAVQDRQPIAYVAELDGIIHPISAEYLTGVIDLADTAGADLVVIILRTPGGLLDSTRTIVSRMITSRAPVVVFVGPAGARAASAGFVLTMAADVAAMAPGTHIGAAHPVSGGGQQMDETAAKKAASDAAAYVRDPRRSAPSQRDARRSSRHREPCLHGY